MGVISSKESSPSSKSGATSLLHLARSTGAYIEHRSMAASRDVGLFPTQHASTRRSKPTSSGAWFHIKSIDKNLYPASLLATTSSLKVDLHCDLLKLWYLQPGTAYLALELEALGKIVELDLKKYVQKRWGRQVLNLQRQHVAVDVSTSRYMNSDVLAEIVNDPNSIDTITNIGTDFVSHCHQDYNLVWMIGSQKSRSVQHQLTLIKWLWQDRSEIYISEQGVGLHANTHRLREHSEPTTSVFDVENIYPYLSFTPTKLVSDSVVDLHGNKQPDTISKADSYRFRNGKMAHSTNVGDQFLSYTMNVSLNSLGRDLFEKIELLNRLGVGDFKLPTRNRVDPC